MMKILLPLLLTLSSALAGPYPPKAGAAGSDAVSKDSTSFVSWANGYQAVEYGADVDGTWKTPDKALGKASGGVYDIVCLGNGGSMTLFFPHPVMDGPGVDFAVFENAISDGFLELAFVEVSSDGVNFFRFPAYSLTASTVGAFGSVNPTNLSGLAGKYILGYGTPFDLASLADSPLLDKKNVRFVRIVDIVGDGNAKDSEGRTIYDPWPVVGSGGFDLEAIGVIHQNDGGFKISQAAVQGTEFEIAWESNPGSRYRVETSITLEPDDWDFLREVQGDTASGRTMLRLPLDGGARRFWRLVRLAE